MKRSVIFTGPRTIQVEESSIPQPEPDEVLVQTTLSAISAGTELLMYRNLFPEHLAVDTSIEGLTQPFSYPLAYGYSAVGQVIQCGGNVDDTTWLGKTVFAFVPHCSHFVLPPAQLHQVPDDIQPENALFAPNMETAVNLVQDGRPLLGERITVLGLGVIGLLTTALLSRFPLEQLTCIDGITVRRDAARAVGANVVLEPTANQLESYSEDLVFEVSGNPEALNTAINITGFGGRIIVGSWYGQKVAPINLGGHYHRNRIEIISSQVSSIEPALLGRWTKTRRFNVVWDMIRAIQPSQWITHRFPVNQAGDAYRMLDEQPQSAIQTILTY